MPERRFVMNSSIPMPTFVVHVGIYVVTCVVGLYDYECMEDRKVDGIFQFRLLHQETTKGTCLAPLVSIKGRFASFRI